MSMTIDSPTGTALASTAAAAAGGGAPRPAKKHRLRAFVVGLIGVDGRDVESPAEAIGPALLFLQVVVNAAVAFLAWTVAVGVFFPSGTEASRYLAGVVGGLLVGFIDWMVVASHPNLPTWFAAGRIRHRRLRKHATLAEMPGGWARVGAMTPRFLFAVFICIFTGLGVGVALNEDSVDAQREQLGLELVQSDLDKLYEKEKKDWQAASEEHGKWEGSLTTAQTNVNNQLDKVNEQQGFVDAAERQVKCESPSDPMRCDGITPSTVGYQRALKNYDENVKPAYDGALKDLTELQKTLASTVAAEPKVGGFPERKTATPADVGEKYKEGLNITLDAYWRLHTEAGTPLWLMALPHLIILVIDVVPVLFKLMIPSLTA